MFLKNGIALMKYTYSVYPCDNLVLVLVLVLVFSTSELPRSLQM